MMAHAFSKPSVRRFSILAAGCLMLAIPGAFAQEVAAPAAAPVAGDEVQQFCTNIADAARDQRYVLQKKELEDCRPASTSASPRLKSAVRNIRTG